MFTASKKEYADAILEKLDPKGAIFSKRLYRENCLECEDGSFLKDLSDLTNVEMRSVVLVDDDDGNV